MTGSRGELRPTVPARTQEDLATRAHIDQADLSRIEGGRTDPRWSTVNRIITALGETLELAAAPTTTRPALSAETRDAIHKTRPDQAADQGR